jgi:hypothetical protein
MTHRLRRSGTGDRLLEAVALQAQELQGENADLRAERDATLANLAAARTREKRLRELCDKALVLCGCEEGYDRWYDPIEIEHVEPCPRCASIRAELAGMKEGE